MSFYIGVDIGGALTDGISIGELSVTAAEKSSTANGVSGTRCITPFLARAPAMVHEGSALVSSSSTFGASAISLRRWPVINANRSTRSMRNPKGPPAKPCQKAFISASVRTRSRGNSIPRLGMR